MKTWKVFGRITASLEECKEIINSFYDKEMVLACYEVADDGCSRDHCHFIASVSYKNLKSLRQAFSEKCFKILGERNQYSVKEYTEESKGEEYICKGHKKDASVKPNIFINTYDIDVEEHYNRFHEAQKVFKQNQSTSSVWKELINYIDKKDPELWSKNYNTKTAYRIASHLFDWYIEKGRMIQGKYIQQGIIRTIIANKFKDKNIKKSIISEWSEDFSYYSSGQEYSRVEDYGDLL